MPLINELEKMRDYYRSRATRPYEFRRNQLLKLRKLLHQYEEEIYDALHTDLGKNREEAFASELGLVQSEISFALKNLHHWMEPREVPTSLVNFPSSSTIYRDPLGVVLIIAPWNYPLNLTMIPMVGALAGGNCVVLKPSEFTPAASAIIDRIILEAFSPEYVKVVHGEGIEVIPAMLEAFRFDHIFFTGSLPVAKSIYKMAAEKLVPVTLELGGKSPGIVEKDANLKVAARRLVMGKFLNSGQTCIAPDYILVHHSVKDELVRHMCTAIEKFYTRESAGHYEYGKLVNEKRFEKLTSYLSHGHILYGGRHDRNRLWIEPTLIDEVPVDSSLMTEEIFGPLLPVISFDTSEQALTIVNRNPEPLAFYLFTSDSEKEKFWIDRVHFGGGCINNTAWYFANKHFPFGGVGLSGLGAYHGKHSFDTFTREKPVLKTPTWFDPSFKYPPLRKRLGLFKKFIR